MEKITRENIEKNYREAIIKKYKSEKVDGKYSHYLDNPSQALLRDLCWEIFSLSPNENDLVVYRNFFRFDFNSKDENTLITYTNKFKKVGAFFREDKVPAKITTVELAAILVDYEPRPFKKFKEKGIPIIEQPIGSPKIPFAFDINDKREEEIEIEGIEIEKQDGDLNYQGEQIANLGNEETFTYDDEKKLGVEIKELELKANNLVDISENLPNINGRKKKYAIVCFSIIVCFIVIFFVFPNKQCMQWSGNHYELVDCDLKIEGFGSYNKIEILDKSLFKLQKVNVCDTTTCFDKNGVAILWYAKTPNGVDFFNAHGRHPENNSPLRPVTRYILNKYVRK